MIGRTTKPFAPRNTANLGASLFAAGGLAAAFGAASCCALPMLFGSLGLGSLWLGGIALMAAPYHGELVAIAALCLAAGGAALFWSRRAGPSCAPGAACARQGLTAVLLGVLSLGAVLAVLGVLYA